MHYVWTVATFVFCIYVLELLVGRLATVATLVTVAFLALLAHVLKTISTPRR